MSPQALSQWAVMNLSMEDRGLLPVEAPPSGDQQRGSARFLEAQLSFFGVTIFCLLCKLYSLSSIFTFLLYRGSNERNWCKVLQIKGGLTDCAVTKHFHKGKDNLAHTICAILVAAGRLPECR